MKEKALYFNPVYLDNEQIVELIEVGFFEQLVNEPQTLSATVRLYVRACEDREDGFDFWIETKGAVERRNYRGSFFGEEEFHVRIKDRAEQGEYPIEENWDPDFFLDDRTICWHLKQMVDAASGRERLEENSLLRQHAWQEIYLERY